MKNLILLTFLIATFTCLIAAPIEEGHPIVEVPVDEDLNDEVPVDEVPIDEVPVDEDPVDEDNFEEDPTVGDIIYTQEQENILTGRSGRTGLKSLVKRWPKVNGKPTIHYTISSAFSESNFYS